MSEELEKKWREEFECTYKTKDHEIGWIYFLAAKTSSYELKENLRKRGNILSKECVELQKEIQKRDELLEQAYGYVRAYEGEFNPDQFSTKWLADYEELKNETNTKD